MLTPEERAAVVETAVAAAPDGLRGHARRRRRTARRGPPVGRARRRGRRAAVMLLPPNAYRADERAVVAHYREVAAAGLPVVAYNNPIDTKVDLTPAAARPSVRRGPDRRRQGVHRRRAPGLRDRRTRPGSGPVDRPDDVVLELAIAGAAGWVAGYPNALPQRPSSCTSAVAGDLEHRAAALPDAAPAAALGLQDRVRAGDQAVHGHGRPLRRAVPAAADAAVGRAEAAVRGPPKRCSRQGWPDRAHPARPPRRRLAHRGHADPRHHRRRRADPRRHHGRSGALHSSSTSTTSARC